MEKWKKITCMTAIYMFLTELRPIEPYMSAYLTGPNGNVSLSEVGYVVEAIKSYSSLAVALVMLVTADFLLYKPNLIFLTVWSGISYSLLIGMPSLTQIRVSAVGIGAIATASVLAYSYLYAQIEDEDQFQMATGVVGAAVQLGRLSGDLSAQLITSVTGGNYTLLPYATVFTMVLAIVWVSLFPKVRRKDYLLTTAAHDEKSPLLKQSAENVTKNYGEKNGENERDKRGGIVKIALKEEWNSFKTSFSNPIVLKYSLWFIFGMTGYVGVLSNKNVLYSYVVQKSNGNQNVESNGLAEALVTLFGAAGAFIMGQVRIDWVRYGDFFTVVNSIVVGTLTLSCYFYSQLYLVYLTNILFEMIIQAQFVLVFTEIAKHLTKKCYSLVLEFNYIASAILVNIVTLTLIQFNFMGITIPGRFLFNSGIFFALAVMFSFNSIHEFIKKKTTF